MITLITGGPGTGKTAWVVEQLLELKKNEPERLLFIHGVRNLRGIKHETIYCRSQLCDICRSQEIPNEALYVETWPQWKQPGSLIVVDEVQRIWRPRVGGTQPHESVSTLETHRHYGVDFWLISQGPHLFDNFIRLLVGRHVHLVSRWSGRTQYEWPECKQDVQSRGDSVQRPYKLPSRVYKMYDSAEVHTKQDKRKPLSFYATIAALFIAAITITYVANRISKRVNPQNDSIALEDMGAGGAIAPPVPSIKETKIDNTSFPDFKPQIEGLAESAPAYRELIKVQQAPLLKGCIKTATACKCFTNQATPYPSTAAFCTEYMRNNVFNPYLNPRKEAALTETKNDHSKEHEQNSG